MEVCVVPEREELPKEHYYGEGGEDLLSFHILMMMMMMMVVRERLVFCAFTF